MCLHEDSDQRDVAFAKLPRVRVEMLLSDLNEMYVKIGQAQRVLREGNPDGKERIVRELLADVGLRMDSASGGFLAPANM